MGFITIVGFLITVDLGYNVMAQNFSVDYETHTTFPSDIIPADVKEISIQHASLTTFPEDAFDKFYQLESLALDYNPFADMPNLIPVGDTLKTFCASQCGMTELNATVYNELRVLETLVLRRCPLARFPLVEAGPKDTLRWLNLASGELTSFPSLAGYTQLRHLQLTNNRIGNIMAEDVSGLPGLRSLAMSGTDVTRLPESPRLLEGLKQLDITATEIGVVPLTCPRYPMEILAEQSFVSLCECDNVWLAALHGQRGSVSLDDMSCEGATSTQELLQARCQPRGTGHRSFHVKLKHSEYFCAFPVYSLTTDISKEDCVLVCAATLGCSSFGFRSTSGELGSCAIIAPTDSALTDIPDAGSPGWNYYTVKEM